MVHNNEGLTTTYYRFHDPDERSPAIQELRRLHDSMDRAVLDVYGWDYLAKTARSESLLEHEIDEEESSKRKKRWRDIRSSIRPQTEGCDRSKRLEAAESSRAKLVIADSTTG